MQVRIYKPSKAATQSGENNNDKWLLEFVDTTPSRYIEQQLGRVTSTNMLRNEVSIAFARQEDAIRFARANNYDIEIIPFKERKFVKKSYASNFK